jgi:hypothetical protein
MKRTGRLFAFVMSVSLAWFGLSGCLKSNPSVDTTARTYLNVMHMAPSTVPVQIYLNDQSSSNSFPVLSYSTLYSPLTVGTYNIKFKKSGGDSLVAAVPALDYDTSRFYTIFTYQDLDNTVKAIRIQDVFNNPATDKIHFRFWHFGPDAPNVDVYIGTDKVMTNRNYIDNTSTAELNAFQDFAPGNYKIYIKETGTDNVLAESDAVDLQPGNYYTFFLKGLTAETGDKKLSLGLLRAAQ